MAKENTSRGDEGRLTRDIDEERALRNRTGQARGVAVERQRVSEVGTWGCGGGGGHCTGRHGGDGPHGHSGAATDGERAARAGNQRQRAPLNH